jgi:hypothetical protein
MRYEAKHHYFKRLAVTTGNFINLPYTLSKRHQESVSYRLQASNGSLSSFIEKGVEIGPGTVYFNIYISAFFSSTVLFSRAATHRYS